MVAMDLKQEIRKLEEDRSVVELEMNSIISRLTAPAAPGLSGNLVDADGFPRSDIDIPSVRADRHRLFELRNDYHDMTDKIGHRLEVLHSRKVHSAPLLARDSGNMQATYPDSSLPSFDHDVDSEGNLVPVTEGAIFRRPFAAVDEISDGSPAALDGVQLGDQIVKFGNVDGGDGLLHRLAFEGTSNQGRPVPMVVLRQGTLINLIVTPRPWGGRGLLGCHFQIL